MRTNKDLQVSAAGAMVMDARTAVEVSTQDATISSDATIRALAGDTAVLGAETLSVQASEQFRGTFGAADLTVGESILLRSGSDVQVSAGGAVTTAATSVELQATEGVDVLGSKLNLVGSEGINIETHGAMFRMIHERRSDSVAFVWTKPVFFDEAEVLLDKPIRRTDRLWIEKRGNLSPAARRSDETASTSLGKVFLDLYSEKQQRWIGVWSAPLATDLLDFHGLSIEFNEQDVSGVRFRSMPPAYSSFIHFSATVLNFGTNEVGIMELEAAEDVRIASGDTFDINTRAASVNAMDSMSLHSGESITLSSQSVELSPSEVLKVVSQDITTYATDSIDSYAGAKIGLTSPQLTLDAFSDAELSAAELIALQSDVTSVTSSSTISAATTDLKIVASSQLDAFANGVASLTVDSATASIGDDFEALVGESVTVTTQDVVLNSASTIVASTTDVSLSASGGASVAIKEALDLKTGDFIMQSGGAGAVSFVEGADIVYHEGKEAT